MLRELATHELPWANVFIVQVDERVAPEGTPDRNLTQLRETLGSHQVYAMPVEQHDLEAASEAYAVTLEKIAGSPPVLDLVHLGLGADGHTASLVPGDAVLDVQARDVAPTGLYQGSRRLTLTYPILNRARRVLWVVTGSEKREALQRLLNSDATIPAGRVRQDRATLIADRAAEFHQRHRN
jgi:6-phosphogluconolactonase/glucosamine-6-phosphate isomerase/deaminase